MVDLALTPEATSADPSSAGAATVAASLPPAASPTPTSPPDIPDGVTVGNILYTTTFQGWPTANDPTAKMSFTDGLYQFEISRDARYYTTLALKQRNMYAQMEVTPKQCPSKTLVGYGLIFRYVDEGNYYLFTIFCDKSFTVGGKVGGSIFGNRGALPGDLDSTSSEAHQVAVLARGDDYTLYFDKKSVGTFQSNHHQQGDVGIYAMSQADEAIRVAFGNLKVWTIN